MDIAEARKTMGITQAALAEKLGMGPSGERTVRGWESGEHKPGKEVLGHIKLLLEKQPYRNTNANPSFRFIDLFAGIGGTRLPFQELGGECVFTSEWDKFSQKTYAANFGEIPSGDITKIPSSEIPEHDLLVAGFPCQAFSQAGLKKGFNDTRGTMFFEIQRILADKRPKAFLLENVKQLKGHDKGRTLQTILSILRGQTNLEIPADIPMSDSARQSLTTPLNYWVDFRVLKASDFGVPQGRERVYIVGFRRDAFDDVDFDKLFKWPEPSGIKTRVGNILESDEKSAQYTISDKLWAGHQRRKIEHGEKGNGFGFGLVTKDSVYTNTISARYYKDGSEILVDQSHIGKNPRKLTPRECARLQGFPDDFVLDAVSVGQIYKQFGNSVAMPVVKAVATAMTNVMLAKDEPAQTVEVSKAA